MEIRIMHSSPSSQIDDLKQLSKIFFPYYGRKEHEELILSLKDLITEGRAKFDGFDLSDMDESISIGAIRNRLKSTGYRARIVYDPLRTLNLLGLRGISIRNGKLVAIGDMTDTELINKVAYILSAHSREILSLKDTLMSMKQKNITDEQKYTFLYNSIKECVLSELNPVYIEIYPPYMPKIKADRKIIDLNTIFSIS